MNRNHNRHIENIETQMNLILFKRLKNYVTYVPMWLKYING